VTFRNLTKYKRSIRGNDLENFEIYRHIYMITEAVNSVTSVLSYERFKFWPTVTGSLFLIAMNKRSVELVIQFPASLKSFFVNKEALSKGLFLTQKEIYIWSFFC